MKTKFEVGGQNRYIKKCLKYLKEFIQSYRKNNYRLRELLKTVYLVFLQKYEYLIYYQVKHIDLQYHNLENQIPY